MVGASLVKRSQRAPRWLFALAVAASALGALALGSCIPLLEEGRPETATSPVGSFVATHGALAVVDGQLSDAHGAPIQLRGVSLFWSQWSGPYYNARTIPALAESWHATVVRAAMGISNPGGYLQDPNAFASVRQVVDAAIAEGIYVIIDWHEELATTHTAQASAFFTAAARTLPWYM